MSAAQATENRFLSGQTWRFVLLAVIVPNLAFLLLMPQFYLFRSLGPLLFLCAAFLALKAPKPVNYFVFIGVALLDVFLIVSAAFKLDIPAMVASLKYVFTISIWNSLLYVAGIAAVMAIGIISAGLINRHRDGLKGFSPLPATIAAMGLCWLGYHFDFKPNEKYDGPVNSALRQVAVDQDGFTARGTNLLVVAVEGMGAYRDADHRQVLQNFLETDAVFERYELRRGTANYSGSTTNGTARELCFEAADFRTYIQGGEVDCLPNRLRAEGFSTQAYHGFHKTLFDRDNWYPKIGFDQLWFKDELLAEYPDQFQNRCGSVFDGLCDPDVGLRVLTDLTAQPDERKFVYWLTLNSHIPYEPLAHGTLNCRAADAAITPRDVCELTEFWMEIFESVAAIASHPDLPPTDIMIVGDHHTPLVRRASKRRFIKDEVDWYWLKDRRGAQ